MSLFGSSNPMMDEKRFLDAAAPRHTEATMTVNGAIQKTAILTSLMLATGIYSFLMPNMILLIVGFIGGLILSLVAIFRPQSAPWAAPGYALFEGLVLGTVSAIYGSLYEGIVFNAIVSTLGLFIAMLFIYRSGIIRVDQKFRMGLAVAMMGLAAVYLVNFVLSFFGASIPMIHEGGTFGIVFSIGVIVIATLNLLVDFDNIEKGAAYGAPKHMEWYSAMGLLMTLVWLYLEILRLLAKLSRER